MKDARSSPISVSRTSHMASALSVVASRTGPWLAMRHPAARPAGRRQHEEPDPLRLCSRSPGSSQCPKGRLEHHYMRKRRETIVANESGPNAGVEGVPEDVKGRAKEAVGAVTGNESV